MSTLAITAAIAAAVTVAEAVPRSAVCPLVVVAVSGMALLQLLSLCAFMFCSSLAVGLLPLFFSLSARRVRYMTTVGVGLLVGVAFIVIIPEGVHTYYAPDAVSHSHNHSSIHGRPSLSAEAAASTTLQLPAKADNSTADHRRRLLGQEADEHAQHAAASDQHAHCQPLHRDSSRVGMALVAGFVLMLLVDRASGGHDGHSHGGGAGSSGGRQHQRDSNIPSVGQQIGSVPRQTDSGHEVEALQTSSPAPLASPVLGSTANHSSAALSSSTLAAKSSISSSTATAAANSTAGHPTLSSSSAPSSALSSSSSPAASAALSSSSSSSSVSSPSPLPRTALLGILTHSAIDGLALGAISVSDNASLELVVFLAIVLHKGPAAFGLASFLLYQGRSRTETRWHLVVFSLAAPVTSILTYLLFLQRELLRTAGGADSGGGGVSSEWLGLCLLFSAGTFLFTIAAHILPEVSRKEGELIEWRYVLCLVVGILLPLALGTAHHHH